MNGLFLSVELHDQDRWPSLVFWIIFNRDRGIESIQNVIEKDKIGGELSISMP
jgi:hypothetical protein